MENSFIGWQLFQKYEFVVRNENRISLIIKAKLKWVELKLTFSSKHRMNLKLPYAIRPAIFFKVGYLGQSNGRGVTFNFWKKKNWKNIGVEMEVLHYAGSKRCCLDWQPYNAYAINRRDFRDLRKCTVTFYCNWICQNAEFVSSFGPETEEKINRRKTKFPLTCSFQKVIKALAFSGREKFGNSVYVKIYDIIW